jgi:hypothetical protein
LTPYFAARLAARTALVCSLIRDYAIVYLGSNFFKVLETLTSACIPQRPHHPTIRVYAGASDRLAPQIVQLLVNLLQLLVILAPEKFPRLRVSQARH